jgi:hypothetical protein
MTGKRLGDGEGRNSENLSEQCRTIVMTPSKLILHNWLFRCSVVATAYVTVLCCNLASHAFAAPFLFAIPPALGVTLGFVILHLIGWDKRT